MKRRISDMLDEYQVKDLELEHSAPLSSQRIKELTMGKINRKEKKSKRAAFRVLAAAAAIAALTMTAFAAEEIFRAGDWFRDILNDELKESRELAAEENLDVTVRETISEGQVEVVNELGESFQPITQTSEGTTMTLAAAYADENVLHLYLQAEAPEGTVLPDDILYQFCDWNAIDHSDPDRYRMFTVAEDAPYDNLYYSSDCIELLPDEDPTDNKKDFHIVLTAQPGQGVKFNDGYSKYLHVDGIYQQVADVDGDYDGYYLLAPGKFTFDIGLANEMGAVELDVDGLTYGGHKTRTWTHDGPCDEVLCEENLTGETDPETGLPIHAESWDYSVTARSLSLSPLSANWTCDYQVSDGSVSCGLDFRVVMKDGTSTIPWPGAGSGYSETSSFGTTTFDTPIDFDEVDYILIGDEEIGSTHKVYLP